MFAFPGEGALFVAGQQAGGCGAKQSWAYLGSQTLSLVGESQLPHLVAVFLSLGWGLALFSEPLLSYPCTSESWSALTTGNSLASTQTLASAYPSGGLSLATQGPSGQDSRSGQSGLSSVPEPDGQSAYRITTSHVPSPVPPVVGQDLVWDMMEKPAFRLLERSGLKGKGSGTQGTRHGLTTVSSGRPHPPTSESQFFHW